MGTTVEIEVDDAHEFMVTKMTDDDTTVDEFVNNMVDQMIYNSYQQNKALEQQQEHVDE